MSLLVQASDPLERDRRWRLLLGKSEEEQEQQQGQQAEAGDSGEGEEGQGETEAESGLSEEDQALDDALDELYGDGDKGGDADSKPDIARWLGDINTYFPSSVVQIMQQDAIEKWKLRKLIEEPEFIEALEPNIALTTQLVALSKLMPDETKASARQVIQKVVDDLKEQLEYPFLQALTGSLNRSIRVKNPRKQKEINWLSTIHANLKHYQAAYKTIVPETLVGHGKQRNALHDVILCIDQSGSMSKSVVYASVFASVMASLPAISTKMVLFDTNVVDVTEDLSDPVDLIFGLRLKGGTNIDKAVAYCETLIERPRDTVLILISDLFEGGSRKEQLVARLAALVESEVKVVSLLALSDEGVPKFNKNLAEQLGAHQIPSFACTPDKFSELMAAVLSDQDINGFSP